MSNETNNAELLRQLQARVGSLIVDVEQLQAERECLRAFIQTMPCHCDYSTLRLCPRCLFSRSLVGRL